MGRRPLSSFFALPRSGLVRVAPLLLVLLAALCPGFAFGNEGASVTFDGTVVLVDGLVDPGAVKVFLTQRAAADEVSPFALPLLATSDLHHLQ